MKEVSYIKSDFRRIPTKDGIVEELSNNHYYDENYNELIFEENEEYKYKDKIYKFNRKEDNNLN